MKIVRAWQAGVALLLVSAVRAPAAVSLLAIEGSGAAGYPEDGFVLTGPAITIAPRLGLGGWLELEISNAAPPYVGFVVGLAGPDGHPPAPGAYEGTIANGFIAGAVGAPMLSFAPAGELVCDRGRGRFIVRQADYGADGLPTAFAADFTIQCDFGLFERGSVRLAADDPACLGRPEGTPCDDLDPCTSGEACTGGRCRGAVPADRCPVPQCWETALCNAFTGACELGSFAKDDGILCDDGEPCTTDDLCRDGVCVGSGEPSCDDDRHCTTDRCQPGIGCVHELPPGDCIEVATRTVLHAYTDGTVNGRPFQCSGRCTGTGTGAFVLDPGGGYRVLPGDALCASNPEIVVPGETGRVQRRRGGRRVLRPDNLDAIRTQALACSGRRVRALRTTLTQSGDMWRGVQTTRFSDRDGLTIAVRGVTRLNGLHAPSSAAPFAPDPPRRGIRSCADGLRLACRLTD